MTDNQETFRRAYANLLSLKTNMPQTHPNNTLEPDIVKIYSEQLDKLESIGINVNEFRIPKEMLADEIVSANYLTDEMVATGRTNVRVGYFKTKLDSLLTYFELNSPPNEKPTIGFHA